MRLILVTRECRDTVVHVGDYAGFTALDAALHAEQRDVAALLRSAGGIAPSKVPTDLCDSEEGTRVDMGFKGCGKVTAFHPKNIGSGSVSDLYSIKFDDRTREEQCHLLRNNDGGIRFAITTRLRPNTELMEEQREQWSYAAARLIVEKIKLQSELDELQERKEELQERINPTVDGTDAGAPEEADAPQDDDTDLLKSELASLCENIKKVEEELSAKAIMEEELQLLAQAGDSELDDEAADSAGDSEDERSETHGAESAGCAEEVAQVTQQLEEAKAQLQDSLAALQTRDTEVAAKLEKLDASLQTAVRQLESERSSFKTEKYAMQKEHQKSDEETKEKLMQAIKVRQRLREEKTALQRQLDTSQQTQGGNTAQLQPSAGADQGERLTVKHEDAAEVTAKVKLLEAQLEQEAHRYAAKEQDLEQIKEQYCASKVVDKEELVAFYAKHDPGKVADVDRILSRYKSRDQVLCKSLLKQYGELPSAPQSKPAHEIAPEDCWIPRSRMVEFYSKHDVSKVESVDKILNYFLKGPGKCNGTCFRVMALCAC